MEIRKRIMDPVRGEPARDQSKITYQNRINLAQKFPNVTFKWKQMTTISRTFLGKLFQLSTILLNNMKMVLGSTFVKRLVLFLW